MYHSITDALNKKYDFVNIVLQKLLLGNTGRIILIARITVVLHKAHKRHLHIINSKQLEYIRRERYYIFFVG